MFTFYFGGLSFNFIRHLVCMILICERSGLKALQWTTPPAQLSIHSSNTTPSSRISGNFVYGYAIGLVNDRHKLTKTAQVRASIGSDFKITYVEIRCLVTCQDTQYRRGIRGIDPVDIRPPLVKIGRVGIVIPPVHTPLVFVSRPTNERWQPRKG